MRTARPRRRSDIVKKHLLALRWTNPDALIYLRESKEHGTAHVEFELCACPPRRARTTLAGNGRRSGFAIDKSYSPELVVAKIMFAARDPALDPPEFVELMKQRAASPAVRE